jgi:hypothetical protein
MPPNSAFADGEMHSCHGFQQLPVLLEPDAVTGITNFILWLMGNTSDLLNAPQFRAASFIKTACLHSAIPGDGKKVLSEKITT